MSITLGQAHETEITLEKAGATPEFWKRLAQSIELARAVVAMVMNTVFRLVAKIDRDMTNWECVEPVEAEEGEFEPQIYEFLQSKESCIDGDKMRERAKEKGISSGISHLEAMLREQEKIPFEWRKYYLVSTEVWQSPHGYRCVWYLCFYDGRWDLHYYWLAYDFYSDYRLVGARKCQK